MYMCVHIYTYMYDIYVLYKICSYIKGLSCFSWALMFTYYQFLSILKSVVSVPNFLLLCPVLYFHLLKGHIGITLTFGTLHLESSVH